MNWFRNLFRAFGSYLYSGRLIFLSSSYLSRTRTKKDHSELHASFDIIRVGKSYRLINYGEICTFEVMEIISNDECLIKSIDTLETFLLSDLTRYGKGADFDFEEL
jgi:hypothetical protein